MPTKASPLALTRVTIYSLSNFGLGYRQVEAKSAQCYRQALAQHSSAVFCDFVPKGCHKERFIAESSNPSIVIVEGWGHPELPTDITKHRAFSSEWNADFEAYLAESGAVIVADFRGVNTYEALPA